MSDSPANPATAVCVPTSDTPRCVPVGPAATWFASSVVSHATTGAHQIDAVNSSESPRHDSVFVRASACHHTSSTRQANATVSDDR